LAHPVCETPALTTLDWTKGHIYMFRLFFTIKNAWFSKQYERTAVRHEVALSARWDGNCILF